TVVDGLTFDSPPTSNSSARSAVSPPSRCPRAACASPWIWRPLLGSPGRSELSGFTNAIGGVGARVTPTMTPDHHPNAGGGAQQTHGILQSEVYYCYDVVVVDVSPTCQPVSLRCTASASAGRDRQMPRGWRQLTTRATRRRSR